jgi:hypothetical protein
MFVHNRVFIVFAGQAWNLACLWEMPRRLKNSKSRFEYCNLQGGAMPIFDDYRNRYDLRDPAKAQEVQAHFPLAQIHRSIDMAESIDEYIFR